MSPRPAEGCRGTEPAVSGIRPAAAARPCFPVGLAPRRHHGAARGPGTRCDPPGRPGRAASRQAGRDPRSGRSGEGSVVFGRRAALAEQALIDGIVVAPAWAAGRSPHPHVRRGPDLRIHRHRQPGTTRQALDLRARLSVRPLTSISEPCPARDRRVAAHRTEGRASGTRQ